MNWQEIRKVAKEKLKPYCRVCPTCNGVVCAGEVPGMGGVGTGSSFIANFEALKRYKLNLSTIHEVRNPNTEIELFGRKLSLPVMAAPITGTTYNMGGAITEDVYCDEVIAGAIMAGTIGWIGDGADPLMYGSGIEAIKRNGGVGIAIIKPRAQDEIIKRIHLAEEAGATAVGIDIDGAGLITMALKGQPVSPKSPKELEELIKSTKLPFVVKGIMTVREAEIVCDIGAFAVVISNHGGRILDHTPGVAEVLPEIADRIKGKIKIIADGGVRSGVDVLKLLALGADAVLIGRPIVIAVFGGGREAVKTYFENIKNDLKQAMLLTGVQDVKYVSRDILRI